MLHHGNLIRNIGPPQFKSFKKNCLWQSSVDKPPEESIFLRKKKLYQNCAKKCVHQQPPFAILKVITKLKTQKRIHYTGGDSVTMQINHHPFWKSSRNSQHFTQPLFQRHRLSTSQSIFKQVFSKKVGDGNTEGHRLFWIPPFVSITSG